MHIFDNIIWNSDLEDYLDFQIHVCFISGVNFMLWTVQIW